MYTFLRFGSETDSTSLLSSFLIDEADCDVAVLSNAICDCERSCLPCKLVSICSVDGSVSYGGRKYVCHDCLYL